jgi:hypothetical protein
MSGITLRHSTIQNHIISQQSQDPRELHRKILPSNATPSIVQETQSGNTIDKFASETKAELRIQTFFVNRLIERVFETPLHRGKTQWQGAKSHLGNQAGHSSLTPETKDEITSIMIERVLNLGEATPIKSGPFLKRRLELDTHEALNAHAQSSEMLYQFCKENLPAGVSHLNSSLSGTRYHWNNNATFNNPAPSNFFDSRLEKKIQKFVAELQEKQLNQEISPEEATLKLAEWLCDYYNLSIAETTQQLESLESFEIALSTLSTLETKGVTKENFLEYLQAIDTLLPVYEKLKVEKQGCMSCKPFLKSARHDYRRLYSLHAQYFQQNLPLTEIYSSFSSQRRHSKQAPIVDFVTIRNKYTLYLEEAIIQESAVTPYKEACTIQTLHKRLFGSFTTEEELQLQIYDMFAPASPLSRKAQKTEQIISPNNGARRKLNF